MSTNKEKIDAQRMALQSTDIAHLRHLIGPEELEQLLRPLQPISTAPRDGKWIILFAPSEYDVAPFRCEIGQFYHGVWRIHDGTWWHEDGQLPTHWMPLPEVPGE